MSHEARKVVFWVSDQVSHNRPVQPQKKVRILKFWVPVQVEEVLYYPCSKNKGADQLRSYCEADLRLCFRTGKIRFFFCFFFFYILSKNVIELYFYSDKVFELKYKTSRKYEKL